MCTKGFYKISQKRVEVEEKLTLLNGKMSQLRDEAKKLKKGSEERVKLMEEAKTIKNSEEYKLLDAEMKTLNFAINSFYYS